MAVAIAAKPGAGQALGVVEWRWCRDRVCLCQLAVATPTLLKVVRCKTGAAVSSSPLSALQGADVVLVDYATSQAVAYGYTAGSQELHIASLPTGEGSTVVETSLSSSQPLSSVSAAGAAGFAAVTADFSTLCTLGAGADQLSCESISSLAPQLQLGSGLRLLATSSGFVLYSTTRGQAGAALLSVSGGKVSLLKYIASASIVSSPVASSTGEVVAFVETTTSGSVLVQALSTATGDLLWNDKVKTPRSASAPQVGDAAVALTGAYLGTFKRKDKGDGYRLVAVWEDGQVALLQQGTSVWSRSEALGTVVAAHFVDLPVPPKAAAAAGGGGAGAGTGACDAGEGEGSCAAGPAAAKGFDWELFVKAQLLSFKVQFKINTPAEGAELMRMREEASDRTAPFRDANGFRKLIVCLTQTGTVTALHNGDGHVVWSRHYSPTTLGAPSLLLPWRLYHDLAHAPQLVALKLGQKQGQGAEGAYASVLDAHNGRELQKISLPGVEFSKALPVNERLVDGHAEQSVYLLIAPEGAGPGAPAVQLLPDTPQSRSWFAKQHRSLYFWLHDTESNTLTGYAFGAEAGVAIAASTGLIPALKVWEVAPSEPILGVTARDPTHAVQSSVKVLGDRSIKYKYLNPNTLVLALGHTPATLPSPTALRSSSRDEDDESPPTPAVTLVVLDTATGRVVYSQVQTGAMGPVRLAMSENMVAAEMWDTVTRRMTLVSMDLFDATPREFSVLDYLFNPNSTQPVSSFDRAPLEVLSQAYWTRAPSRFLAFTTTQQGITSKQLLAGMLTDQLYGMDARFIDPRRPRRQKLTQQEQEERLIPYQEYLPLVPPAMLSYDHQILGLSRVVIEPSRLESTCLIFASGVDLYYTRLAPARKYDSLEDDFAYGLLVVALLGLGMGAAFMHRMTKKTMLEQKWK